jgi:adenylate cyclase
MSFLGEIKRRKVFQVAAVYAVVAWLVVQVAVSIEEPLGLPGWMDTFVIVLVIFGFPLALILSWIFDLTPAGIVRTEALSNESDTTAPGESGTPPADLRRKVLPNSVAVLPLENLSPNADDAYFAAGIHEEILNYLAKIGDLNVIARTSVRQYADTQKPVSQIAQELGVSTILEGSVRYSGHRVRIAAQLIEAATENHLWSEIYERDLVDVFAIQADVARNIAEALQAKLSAADEETLESLPKTRSSEAHTLYLESQALIAQSDVLFVTSPASIRASVQAKLSRSIDLDPEFAHPYALKALLSAISRIYDPVTEAGWSAHAAEADESVRANAEKALALSPSLRAPHLALALNHQFNWRGQEAQKAYERALERGPNDASVLHWYSGFKWLARDFEHALELAKRAVALDPGNILSQTFFGLILHSSGDHEASAETFEKAIAAHPASAHLYLHSALPLVALGHEARALERLKIADQLMPEAAAPAIHIHVAYGYARLGRSEEALNGVAKAKRIIGDLFVDPAVWAWASLAEGDQARALGCLRSTVEKPELRQEVFVRGFVKENAWHDPVLEQPEFLQLRDWMDLTGLGD